MAGLSAEATRYLAWAAAVVLGMLFALVDRRIFQRWILGALLLVGVAGGFLLTVLSPFSFGNASYYMEGVILAGGCALALGGYVFALCARALSRLITGGKP